MVGAVSVTSNEKKIAVALSGGVDSAVAAALLQRDGHDVTAFFARGWSPKESRCDWAAEERDAMRVAAALGVPFRSVDLGNVYEREVVAPLLDGYRNGRATNPDVWCNKSIKFGALLSAARAEGFSSLATGHYARLHPVTYLDAGRRVNYQDGPADKNCGEAGIAADRRLYRGTDAAKDQSYFLWALGPNELAAARFPLGELTKVEVRALAKKLGLPVAEKRDSQGVCFVGEMDFKEFLRARLCPEPGEAVDAQGDFVGRHDGAILYVPGERVALADVREDLRGVALYVLRADAAENRLVVGPAPTAPAGPIEISLSNVSETSPRAFGRAAACQLRYRSAPATVTKPVTYLDAGRRVNTYVESPGFVPAPGQSAVFYGSDGECLGGGEVTAWRSNK